ncbi:MAG: ATP-binding protein [Pseudonocardiaceae bacterium]
MSPARRTMTDQAADAAVDQACRGLRLPSIRAQFTQLADAAEREQMTYRGFLAELLMVECDDRDRRRSERRIRGAGFPRQKWLADFDYTANPNINPVMINMLASCGWVRAGEPLCLIGDSGTGNAMPLRGTLDLRASTQTIRRPSQSPGRRPS